MAAGLKIAMVLFGLLLVAAVIVAGYGVLNPQGLVDQFAPGSAFNWDNFDPLSRDRGLWGLSPLIWTALFVLPLAIGVPIAIYVFERKKVPAITRAFLAISRGVVILLLYLLLAGPSVVDSEQFVEGSKVAVLLDDSLSMGAESRAFPIFSVLEDREADDVRNLRNAVTAMGVIVDRPPHAGFVTLTDDELAVRNFVRQVVRQRAERLMKRLRETHGRDFDIGQWQRLRAEVERMLGEADLLQSALSAETSKDEPNADEERRLRGALSAKQSEIETRENRFSELLGGDASDPEIIKKRALIDNLLETVHPEGPRRWDIACELIAQGSTLAAPPGETIGLIDLIRSRGEQINASGKQLGGPGGRTIATVRYFVFSTRFGREQLTEESILEIAPEDLDFRAPRGRLTELDKALAEVRRYYTEDDDLASIIVLSDGRDTTPAAEREEAAPKARQGTEVVTVAVGNPKPVKVLELLSVSADREILKGDYLDFKLKIRADEAYRADPASGRPGQKIEIILCEDSAINEVSYEELNGRPVRSADGRTIELGPEELAEVRIRFKPQVTGRRLYIIKLNRDRLPDEDTYRNNIKEHSVTIIDRKIKVLYLEQRFRWQARALNDGLKRDKRLEYQGYFFDAQDGWTQPTSQYDDEVRANVKPLPAPFFGNGRIIRDKEEFFALNYDVIILGDIDPSTREWRFEYWDWIEEWVSRHRGGLILLAGQMYNPRAYASFDKARALYPVEVADVRGYDAVDVGELKYWRLTPAGRAHETHRLSTNPDRNDALWGSVKEGSYVPGELQGLYWYNVTSGIKPAPAVALSRVARSGPVTTEGEVLTAAMPYGSGMTFYCGSDDTHYWRQWVGDHYFYSFWQNTLRFVASRRLAGKQQRVDVYTDKAMYQVSDDVKIYVELLGDIYNEVVQNQLKDLRELPTGEGTDEARRIIVDVQSRTQGRQTLRKVVLREVSWSPNLFEGIVEANEPGHFDVWVREYEDSHKSPHRYTVVAPTAELRNLTLDMDGLRERASKLPAERAELPYQAGKRLYIMTDMGQAAVEVRERRNEVKGVPSLVWDRNEDKYGLRSLLLMLVILMLAGEWLTRKLVRMV